MLTSEGNHNHCHDCEKKVKCAYRISDLWLCNTCDDKRRRGLGPKPGPRYHEESPLDANHPKFSAKSPFQKIQGIVKSIGKAGRSAMQRAKATSLRRTVSSDSIMDYLPVRPLHELAGQQSPSQPANTENHCDDANSPALSPAHNDLIWSQTPLQQGDDVEAETTLSQLADDLEVDEPPTQITQNSSQPAKKKKKRRSYRLRGEPPPKTEKVKSVKLPKKDKTSGKIKKKTKQQAPTSPHLTRDPVRCCSCMNWFNPPEEEVFGGTVWVCNKCRTVPDTILEIRKDFNALMKTNMDLVASLAAKIAENDELRKENFELRQMMNKEKPAKSKDKGNGKHLIITDATLEGLSANDESKVEIIYEPAACFAGCKELLTKRSNMKYNKVSIITGHTDCAENKSIDELSDDISIILEQAKSLSSTGYVQISSVLPQLHNDSLQQRAEEFNSFAETICKKKDITFVNNDPGFRLGDGDINEGFFQDDGFTLNKAGKSKLLKNLKIQDDVSFKPLNVASTTQFKSVARKAKMSQQKNEGAQEPTSRAPCFNCGERNHTSNKCHYRKRLTCRRCGKAGHKSNLCGRQ